MKEGDLFKEYQKLIWLEENLSVPRLVLFTKEFGNEYMITEGIDGQMLASSYYKEHVDEAIKVIKEAFTKFYQMNILECPFIKTNKVLLNMALENIKNNIVSEGQMSDWAREKFETLDDILQYLEENRYDEELVFSYGDLSLPNIFASKDKLIGFVDVGECGVADKWLDIAICEKSIRRNLGDCMICLMNQSVLVV